MKFVFFKINKNINYNIFIIDEGFLSFDNKNKNKINNIVQNLQNKFKNLIIITHDDFIKELCDYNINIIKDSSNMSTII